MMAGQGDQRRFRLWAEKQQRLVDVRDFITARVLLLDLVQLLAAEISFATSPDLSVSLRADLGL